MLRFHHILILIVLAFSGCGGSGNPTTTNMPAAPVPPAPPTSADPWFGTAGNVLLSENTSNDTDGVQDGFDCAMTSALSRATNIPIIASGGAGKPEHFVRVLTDGLADAALAASIFHYGTYTVNQLKEELDKRGICVRVA